MRLLRIILKSASVLSGAMAFQIALSQSSFNSSDSFDSYSPSYSETFESKGNSQLPSGEVSTAQNGTQEYILPRVTADEEGASENSLVSVDFRGTPLSDVLRTLAEASGLNLVLSPNIQGSTPVTMKLDDVTYQVALETVINNYSLDTQVTGSILRLDSLDRVANEINIRQQLQATEWNSQPTRILVWQLNYADAATVSGIISSMVQSRFGDLRNFAISTDLRSNKVIIESIPDVLERAKALLKTIDVRKKQVLIEARIIEASRELSRTLGVSWGARFGLDANRGLSTGLVFPNSVIGNIGGAGAVGQVAPQSGVGSGPTQQATTALTIGSVNNVFNLDAVIQAYESENMANVIASPSIVVEDQEDATISETTTLRREIVTEGVITTNTTSFELSLQVTPKITSDGNVQMVIQVQRGIPTGIGADSSNAITTRQAETNLSVKDGETAVIGGLFQSSKVDSAGKIPILGDLPLIGWLFRSKNKQILRSELMVLITPRILKEGGASSGEGSLGGISPDIPGNESFDNFSNSKNSFSNSNNNFSNQFNNATSSGNGSNLSNSPIYKFTLNNTNSGTNTAGLNSEDESNALNNSNGSFNNSLKNGFNNGGNNTYNNEFNNSFNNEFNNDFNNNGEFNNF